MDSISGSATTGAAMDELLKEAPSSAAAKVSTATEALKAPATAKNTSPRVSNPARTAPFVKVCVEGPAGTELEGARDTSAPQVHVSFVSGVGVLFK